MGALTGTVRDSSGAVIGVDLYNMFNASDPTLFDQTYDYAPTAANPQGWLQPTTIVQPRFVRFNVTVSF
jgi:hypothetical protein